MGLPVAIWGSCREMFGTPHVFDPLPSATLVKLRGIRKAEATAARGGEKVRGHSREGGQRKIWDKAARGGRERQRPKLRGITCYLCMLLIAKSPNMKYV